jgi:hypothetical protein
MVIQTPKRVTFRVTAPTPNTVTRFAHTVRDTLGRTYNRTEFIDQRREMMPVWADYLDQLRKGATVIPLREVAGGDPKPASRPATSPAPNSAT